MFFIFGGFHDRPFYGASEGNRTLDILFGRQKLYQLSYTRLLILTKFCDLRTLFDVEHFANILGKGF